MAKKNKKNKKKKKYTRCIKRYSLRINDGKWGRLQEMLHAYCEQKDEFLKGRKGEAGVFASFSFREIRDSMVEKQYKSRFALQARIWKLSLKDACDTLDRYWAALEAGWRTAIAREDSLLQEQKDALYFITGRREPLYHFLLVKENHEAFTSLIQEQKEQCVAFLTKIMQETVKKQPRVQIERSFLVEPETYRIFEEKGRQYIAVMSMDKGERICIPLTGHGNIKGEARVVFDFEKQRIAVHFAVTHTFTPKPFKTEKIGIDFGITEVFTDSDDSLWGTDFGKTTQKYSDEIHAKGKKRNKLHALAKKHKKNGNKQRARNIRRNNLGKKKQKKTRECHQKELTRQVNQAFNEFFQAKEPQKVVHENLSNLRGKAKSKKMSRLVSSWIRTTVNERLDFKASQRGSLLAAVNPAYSSTTCPQCGWVDRGNRNGDKFKCRFCGYTGACDHIAAREILRRENDPEILWMPKEQVRKLLVERFRRRLESKDFVLSLSQTNWEAVRSELGDFVDRISQTLSTKVGDESSATVPGKTPDAFPTENPQPSRKRTRSRKRKPLGERN